MSAVMEEKTFRGLREVALLSVIAGALFFLISLLTFNNDDAGWTHSGSVQSISNACGVFGAWLADFMLSFFGLCAYVFPFVVIWQGYLTYSQRRLEQSHMMLTLHWLGTIATIISVDALFNFYLLRTDIELPRNTGGILGQEIGTSLAVAFGNSGATLFLLVILFAGLRLVTEISLFAVLDFIGKYSFSLVSVFYRIFLKKLHQQIFVKPVVLQLVDENETEENPVARKRKSPKTQNAPVENDEISNDENNTVIDELLTDSFEGKTPKSEPEKLDKPTKTPLGKKFEKLAKTVKHAKVEQVK